MTNSLKLSDAIHLSWANIFQHKSRSLIIILTISVLFGLLIGVSFILCGLENSLLDVASAKTSGAFYIESYYINTSQSTSDQKVLARLEKYHGESIGTIKEYNFNSAGAQLPFAGISFRVVNSSAIAPFLDIDLAKIPNDKIPVLAPENGFTFDEEIINHVWLQEQVSDKYYIAGYLPVMQTGDQPYNGTFEPGYSTPFTPTIPSGFNLLNLILGNISAGPTAKNLSSSPILIDDGSGKVDAYLEDLINIQTEATEEDYYGSTSPTITERILAKFTNPRDLIRYTAPTTSDILDSDTRLNTTSFISNPADITFAFHSAQFGLIFIGIIILILAIIVTILTFSHLIDQDASAVALYRSMGASNNNISLIYFLYLLILCFFAIVTSIIIGLVLSFIASLLNTSALATRLQDLYLLSSLPHVSFLGIDQYFWIIIFTILITAPLVLIFTQKHFTAKHIAKTLKEN